MMEIIDHLLHCNDEEIREVFYPRANTEEATTYNQNKYGGLVANQVDVDVNCPTAHDVNTLSLNELIEIESKLDRDSPPESNKTTSHDFIKSSTNFIGSGGNDNSTSQFNIDDIICGDESQDGKENVDFAIDSDDKVTSYIDCMEPSSSKGLQPYSNMMEVNLTDPPEISNLLNNFTSTEASSTSALPNYTATTTTDFGEIFDFANNENSDIQALNLAGMKRSLPNYSFPNFESNIEPQKKMKVSEHIEDSTSDSDVSMTPVNEFDDLSADQKDEFEGITDRKEIRKIKNNKASRVHRAKKKRKSQELFDKKTDLEKRNAALKMQVESMEKEISFLKELLLVKVAATSNT